MKRRLSHERKMVLAKTMQILSHIGQYPGGKIGLSDIHEKMTTMSSSQVKVELDGLADWADEYLTESSTSFAEAVEEAYEQIGPVPILKVKL